MSAMYDYPCDFDMLDELPEAPYDGPLDDDVMASVEKVDGDYLYDPNELLEAPFVGPIDDGVFAPIEENVEEDYLCDPSMFDELLEVPYMEPIDDYPIAEIREKVENDYPCDSARLDELLEAPYFGPIDDEAMASIKEKVGSDYREISRWFSGLSHTVPGAWMEMVIAMPEEELTEDQREAEGLFTELDGRRKSRRLALRAAEESARMG